MIPLQLKKNKVFGVKITKHILFFTEMKYYHFEISYAFLFIIQMVYELWMHIYTTTHRNKTVNVYKIKHILYWYFQQSQCLNLRKTYSTQHT